MCQEEGLYDTGCKRSAWNLAKSTLRNTICSAKAILACSDAQLKAVDSADYPVVVMDG